jgi:HAMP domain-containing protein
MKEKRGKIWKIKLNIKILDFALITTPIFFLIILYAFFKVLTELQYSLIWQIHLIILLISFTVFGLMFLTVMFVILHRILGPINRMEKILDGVANKDYSLRMTVRKRDIIYSLVNKVNKVLDLLEEKTKI